MNAFLGDCARGFQGALKALFADRAAVMSILVATVIYSFYYPAAYSYQVASRLPTVVVDLDRSPMSRDLLRKLGAVRAVDLIAPEPSLAAAQARMSEGKADGILIVDADFERDILRGDQGRVTFLAEGALLSRANTVLQGLADAVAGFSQDAVLVQAQFEGLPNAAPMRLVQRPLFNTREGYASAVVTAVAVLIVQQTLLLGMVLLIGTHQELRGRLALSAGALSGALAAFWSIGLLNLLYYSGFVYWFQDFPRGGNLPGLLVCAMFYIAAVVAFAAFVGSFFRVRERAMQVILLLSMPLYFLAGLSWPATSMPDWLNWLAKLVPTTAGINAMVKVNAMGARLHEVVPELATLAILALGYGAATLWRYRPPTPSNPSQNHDA
ncbi:ABC transporter permease [Lysobacter enzymogenes]|uniref:ABC transporter permease n=1 Tax=Lysobacter enzymogenes TaxID=69 RepID=A0A3N2RFP7_LYSEN|nr:ABC transporter permease [Lysobacter enzymogenes]ROU06267.1 ABC transporter permease [Lysobacter enzymogenes]